MNAEQSIIVALDIIQGASKSKKRKIIELVENPVELLSNLEDLKEDIVSITDYEFYSSFKNALSTKNLDKILTMYEQKGINVITAFDDTYPIKLRQLYDYPLCLYYIGDVSLLLKKAIAVVGTRRPTRFGADATKLLAQDLAHADFVIISGMARGVDTIAHASALEVGKNTIAVLGCGVDVIYPSENKALYSKIATRGLIVSEYPMGTEPQKYHFPERNRIVSGLSDGVLITEAGEKSGSLITMKLALEEGKRLFVVPSHITNKQAIGSNRAIRDMQGSIVLDVNDILSEFNMFKKNEKPKDVQLDIMEQMVVTALETSEMHFEDLLMITNLKVQDLNSLLTRMEILGIIKKLAGNNYAI